MNLTKNEAGYYEVRFKDAEGKVRTMTTHRKNRKEAAEIISKARIAEMELAAEIGILGPSVASIMMGGKKMTVEEAIDPWKEWRAGRRHSPHSIAEAEIWVKAWAASQGVSRTPLTAITERRLDPWVNSTTSRNKMGTRLVMLSALRSFFSYCSARGWCTGNPAVLVTVDPWPLLHTQKESRRPELFTDDDVACLLALTGANGRRPNQFWHAAIAISRWTGLRLGDVACLEWSCLAIPGKIAVWTQKRDRRVELPLEPEGLRNALLEISRYDPEFMFPEQREIVRNPKRRALLSTQFGKLCVLCGIFGKSFHGLRHTYVSDCYARGIPIEHISTCVGHSDAEVTRRYVHPTD
jgi:integrase